MLTVQSVVLFLCSKRLQIVMSVEVSSEMIRALDIARSQWEENRLQVIEAMLDKTMRVLEGEALLRMFLSETDQNLPVNRRRWLLLGPVVAACEMDEYGASGSYKHLRDMEAKRACGLPKKDCVVFSVGSNGQWAFEIDIVNRTDCEVHTFDCTIDGSVHVPDEIAHRVHLHRYCFGRAPPASRSYSIHVPSRKDGRPGPWSSREWRRHVLPEAAFINYSTALSIAGLTSRPPSLLKMDIEGYEWEVLPAVIKDPWRPAQMAIELHYQTQFPGLSWFGRFKSPAEIVELGSLLRSVGGYHLVSRVDNGVCRWCTETLWIRPRAKSWPVL